MDNSRTDRGEPDFDVVVVGGGAGGIFAVHELVDAGFSVLGIESAPDVGGVWYHNRYPGARVDVESYFYCFVDPLVYPGWKWSERYAAQPEILAYLRYAADVYGVRPHFRFSTWMTGAQWEPERNWYRITTDAGDTVTARYLVMSSGQLSKPRKPDFPGFETYEGDWVQTSNWPDRDVQIEGKRVAVIGTGSSGVQVVPPLARAARHLYVFQRTANYSVPAQNAPIDPAVLGDIAQDAGAHWEALITSPTGTRNPRGTTPAAELTHAQQRAQLEKHWAWGGHSMNSVFPDQSRNIETNTLVADFVREKVRERVSDPVVAEKLLPMAYPIGSRRLCVDIGYYETFNRDNVTLVDIKSDPIEEITPTGIKTRDAHYDVDLIVFALGFSAFTGALDQANIRNEHGEGPTTHWNRGPVTHLGLMTTGFPNLFVVTGPGSPSVLANMIVGNMQHVRYIRDLLIHMRQTGLERVEPTEQAQKQWTQHVQDASNQLLRLNVENYMVHVNRDDGSRIFIPYTGGLDQYVRHAETAAANDYEGFDLV